MSITFTPAQENLIKSKLKSGKYSSTEEVLDIALRLLDEYDHADGTWVEEVRAKIDTVIESQNHTAVLSSTENPWQAWFDSFDPVSDDFITERIQPPIEHREAL